MGDSIGDAEQYPPSVDEMDELTKVFNRFDVDGDGRISAAELKSVLGALGSGDTSDAEISVMIAEMDSDNDGFVDLREIAAFHLGEKGKGPRGGDVELRDAFDLYDLDKNGLISAAELHLVLQKLGERCSVKDCERMIGSVDSDGDGSVSFGEFKKMMGKKGSN